MKVGFTGPRLGMTLDQQDRVRIRMHDFGAKQLHHGDCIGADVQAHAVGRQLGLWIVGHPPVATGWRAGCDLDEERVAQEFLIRNRSIVMETELLIATPAEFRERLRSGTWSTVRIARRAHMPFLIIYPDGSEGGELRGLVAA